MFSRDDRREGRNDRPRRHPGRIVVEGLETRQLMTYSPYGYSLPNLAVSGYAAQVGAWGGAFSVDVTVQNQGASSLIEPTHIFPSTTDPNTGGTIITGSNVDAKAAIVDVYASTKPNATTGLIKIDSISIPAISQNSQFTTNATFNLPSRPRGFPNNGGKIFLTYILESNQPISQAGQGPAFFRVPLPVKIVNPLPNLQVIAEDIPRVLQPGDVISPTIQIENFGAGNPALQGPVTVDLVASLDKNFGPGDSVIGSYVIQSLPGLSQVPTQIPGNLGIVSLAQSFNLNQPYGLTTPANVNGLFNLVAPVNVNTTTIGPIKLPTTPGFYYIGIEIDPTAAIKMTHPPIPALMGVLPVGPPNLQLPPSTQLINTSGIVPVFPALPYTVLAPTPKPPISTTPTTPILVVAF